MDLRRILPVLTLSLAAVLLFSGMAEAANGTVRVTFKYKNGTGVEQALPSAYLYLRSGTEEPPLQKYFKNADYIFGPSDSLGRINASVPEGTYYTRLTRRMPLGRRDRWDRPRRGIIPGPITSKSPLLPTRSLTLGPNTRFPMLMR